MAAEPERAWGMAAPPSANRRRRRATVDERVGAVRARQSVIRRGLRVEALQPNQRPAFGAGGKKFVRL